MRRSKGSNQHKEKVRYYGLKGSTWRDIIIVLYVLAAFCFVAMHARAEGFVPGAYVSPIPFAIGNLDENGLPVLTPEEQLSWDAFQKAAHKLAPIYDYPVKVIIAQAALESGRGTSRFARERFNYFGYQCYDRDPEKYCATFQNMEQGIIEYLRLIKTRYPAAYENRQDPERMIELIKAGGYATDPNYVQKIKALPEWRSL